ncbi:MAG: ATP-binding protein [Candidatus Solibacter usitatus]|nr:ATP-binding protein [Candidatus Solibacter usitatus]
MTNFERRFLLHVPSSTENLALIRDFVANIGKQAGLPDSDLSMIELAVDEACANVIEHAYGSDGTKEVIVRAMLDAEAITIEVVDTGKGFDPNIVEQKELKRLVEERRSGGLGMRMMKLVMDEVQYNIKPGERNELRMVKRLKH